MNFWCCSAVKKSSTSWWRKIDNFLISGEAGKKIQFCVVWVKWWIRGIFDAISLKIVCKDPRWCSWQNHLSSERRKNCDHHVMAAAQCCGVWEDDLSSEMNFNLSSELLRQRECQLRESCGRVENAKVLCRNIRWAYDAWDWMRGSSNSADEIIWKLYTENKFFIAIIFVNVRAGNRKWVGGKR